MEGLRLPGGENLEARFRLRFCVKAPVDAYAQGLHERPLMRSRPQDTTNVLGAEQKGGDGVVHAEIRFNSPHSFVVHGDEFPEALQRHPRVMGMVTPDIL